MSKAILPETNHPDLDLYHISHNDYPLGKVNSIVGISYYHQLTVDNKIDWVNDFLDNEKPHNAPSRKKAFYACDSITNCVGFWGRSKCISGSTFLYKVKMLNPCKVPMSLVNTLNRKGISNPSNHLVAQEYWMPTQNWSFYEYLSEEMQIIEKIEIKNEYLNNNAVFLIGKDRDLANKLFLQ